MPDLHKPIRQDVEQKAPNELKGIQSEALDLIMVSRVSIADGDPIVVKVYDALIRYCHPVGIASQIRNHGLSIFKRGLAVDDPILAIEFIHHRGEGPLFSQMRNRA